jgi:hypothetical protein
MRTTIRLDDVLLRQAKAMAAMQGRPLNDFIVDAVRAAVSRRVVRDRIPLPSFKGEGLQYGVDLDDSSSLLDLMEGASFSESEAPRLVRRVAEPSSRRRKK